jgi:hypothetical protein
MRYFDHRGSSLLRSLPEAGMAELSELQNFWKRGLKGIRMTEKRVAGRGTQLAIWKSEGDVINGHI